MDIIYLGHSAFKLKGKTATVVCDPFHPSIGLHFPKNTEAQVVTISHGHDDHNASELVSGNPVVFTNPGEYEAQRVEILGIASFHDAQRGAERGDNTVFKIELDGVHIVHLGDLGHPLSEADIELLDEVDVLLVPVGGHFTIDAQTAAKLVADIEPRIVIPMHYQVDGLIVDLREKLVPVSAFFKALGKDMPEVVPKLTLKAGAIPEEMQVVLFE